MAIHLKSDVCWSPSQKIRARERTAELCRGWEAGPAPHHRARGLSSCFQQNISENRKAGLLWEGAKWLHFQLGLVHRVFRTVLESGPVCGRPELMGE